MWCVLLLSVFSLSLGCDGAEAMREIKDSGEVCAGGHQHKYKHTVYVNPSAATVNCDLQPLTVSATCPDINTALAKNSHRGSTAFVLSSDVTHVLKPGTQSFLRELTDVGFFGESSSNLAHVECEDGAGLAFWNVDRIQLQNVEFSFCGALRDTASKNFTQEDDLMKVRAGLYFYNGTNVTICHVTVQHGPNSLGVLMYDTDGTVNIYHSNFVNNTNSTDTGGGGVYVEFSYSVPGDEAREQLTHSANSSYVFHTCTFVNNSASTSNANNLATRYSDNIPLGRGGGLAVFFNHNATGNTFQILGCLFEKNKAYFGGGLYILFKNTSIGNTVTVNATSFDKNVCSTLFGIGGALRVYSELKFGSKPLYSKGNRVTVSASDFSENQALQGGGIAFSPTYQIGLTMEQMTQLRIGSSNFSGNHAQLGAAIHTGLSPFFVNHIIGTISDVNIKDCIFKNNSIHEIEEAKLNYDMTGIGTVYTSQVPLNFSSRVEFFNNSGSALALTSTYATFYDTNGTFLSNRGDTGGAIALLGNAYAIVNENTSMCFKNNSARKGGAIYNLITGRGTVRFSRACFIQNSDPLQERETWKASFIFENNILFNNVSNSIYTTSAYPCARLNTDIMTNLTETLLFCNNPNWKFVDSTCVDEIQTEGNSYNFTNVSISSFPGMGFELPVQVYDDLGHNITNFTGYNSTVSPNQPAQVDPRFSQTSNNYLSIEGQENTTVTLELRSTGLRTHYLQMEVKLLRCPPGLHLMSGKCRCNPALSFAKNLNCSSSMQHIEASIPRNFWIGHLDQQTYNIVMAEVPNIYSEQESEMDYYRVLPKSYEELDGVICGDKNRTGILCGSCRKNFSTSVNSYNYVCTPCNDDTDFVKNIFIFIIFSYLPYIILLGAIAYFNLKLTSSATNGFILYAQMTSLDIFNITSSSWLTSLHAGRLRKAHHYIYGIFNFNSFANVLKPFCIHKNWTTLDVFLLEYTLAGLPILLILLLYLVLRLKSIKFLCCRRKPLSIRADGRRKKVKEKSLIHILVACILLSYTKITVVSMKMLSVQKPVDGEGHYLSNDPRIYFAGHLSFFSKKYLLPYGVIAMLMMLIFVLLPPLFLLGMPQLIDRLLDTGKFPRCFKRLWPTVTINIFLDAFQGFYKPALYCRIFAGLYFVFRLLIVILYVATSDYLIVYFWQQFFIVLMILLLSICQPYKKRIFNILDTLIFFNLASVNMITTYAYTSSLTVSGLTYSYKTAIYILQYTLLWLPLVYMLSYVGYKILAKLGITRKFHRDRQQAVYFNTRVCESRQTAPAESEEEEEGDHLDSDSMLSDSALFSRARFANKFRPPKRQNPTRTMVDVSQQSVRVEEDQSGSLGSKDESNANNSRQFPVTY